MLPIVLPGARLRFSPCSPAEVRIGDVLLVERSARLVAHRVVARTAEGIVLHGDGHKQPDVLVHPAEVLARADGVPLFRSQLPLPPPIAAPLNRALGAAGRSLTAVRGTAGRHVKAVWNGARRVSWVGAARSSLQPFRVVRFDASHVEMARELMLRAKQRPTADALSEWRRAAAFDGAAAWLAASGERTVGWLVAIDAGDAHRLRLWVGLLHRGLGIASSLVESAISLAEERGWSRLRIACSEASAEWLAKRGFVRVGGSGAVQQLERVIGSR